MAKISKDELKQKISERIADTDLAIELLEDIDDSMEMPDNSEAEGLRAELEKANNELNDLKEKYKARFTESTEVKEESATEVVDDGLTEEEYVDVKDIFY